MKLIKKSMPYILAVTLFLMFAVSVQGSHENNLLESYDTEIKGIKNINGKFYAYVVLLFNENPHFVNLIQKDSIPLKIISQEGFNIREYRNYLKTISNKKLKSMAWTILSIYLEPKKFSTARLTEIEQHLIAYNIIIQFSREKSGGTERISLNYCIFGKKIPITINHPLVKFKEKIYNIIPYIYYDEFSTSNSTFYYDMIYINSIEVENDFVIAQKILSGENVNSYFFVGSKITSDITYCLKRAFANKQKIKDEIWKMFVIHELTHKMLNNNYNNYDQVTGEELSLCSTIYSNTYLGLSVMYSYINYNSINPHRIAASNYINYIAEQTAKNHIIKKPELIKYLDTALIKELTKKYFNIRLDELK